MSGIPHDHYEPKTKGEKWVESRLPIIGLLYNTLMIPTPKNLNWMWIWGIVLTFCLVLQIVTGIVLAMHYTPHVDQAFNSIEHIMRNVNGCAKDDPDDYAKDGIYLSRKWTSCAPGTALEMALHPGGHRIPKGWSTLAMDWFEALPPTVED